MIKAVFFDIDGTLVSLKSRVYPASIPGVLKQLRDKGILLFVATGRSKFEIAEEHLLDGLEFDGYLTNNGQDCYDAAGKSTYSKPLAKEEVAAILQWTKEHNEPCWMVSGKESRLSFTTERSDEAFREIHTRNPAVGTLDHMVEDDVYKIVLFLDRVEAKEPLALAPNCRWTQWAEHGCDIICADGGKVNALREIVASYGILPEEVMAFGDSHNDMEMMQAAGIGIAMDNATQECKDIADYIADDCDADGIAKALQHFGLIDTY